MDTMLLMLAFIAFFALVAAWLVLPASKTVAVVASAPRRAAVQV